MVNKNKLRCQLCGMEIEITNKQYRALLDGIILINNAFPEECTAKTTSAVNDLFKTIECEHDFEWV